jgi:NAD(P)-dependent dehydrogenase (short-subunit alcohol dehydrogenase family)
MTDRKGRVEGKVALVTGAAAGLGAAAARRLAAEGASVMLTDIAEDAGRAVADEIEGAGGKADFSRHDVTSESDWDEVVKATVARFGRLTVLVNNAGIADAPLELMTHDFGAWRRTMSSTSMAFSSGCATPARRSWPPAAAQ